MAKLDMVKVLDATWTEWWTVNGHRFTGTREKRFNFPVIAKEFARYYHDKVEYLQMQR